MSNKLPMMDVTKVHLHLSIKVETRRKLDVMAANAGVSIGELVASVLDNATRNIALSAEDAQWISDTILSNIEKRENSKARKGIR